MADLSDALTALAQGLAGAIYPNGTGAPSAIGAPAVVFPGWPDPASLDADLEAGRVQISVFSRPGMARVQRRSLEGWQRDAPLVATMTAVVSGDTVTLAGAGSTGQIAGVLAEGKGWAAAATGTPSEAAAALAAAIAQDRPATAAAAVLTLPGATGLRARILSPVPEAITLRRQAQSVQVTVWAPTPELRDAAAKALDLYIGRTSWLALPASEVAHLSYGGTVLSDEGRQARLYRRDLIVTLDYPTTDRRISPPITILEIPEGPMDPSDAPIRSVIVI